MSESGALMGNCGGWYGGGSQLSQHDSGVRTSLAVLDGSVAEACMAHDAADCAQCSFHGAATPIMADYGARLGGGSFRGALGRSTMGIVCSSAGEDLLWDAAGKQRRGD